MYDTDVKAFSVQIDKTPDNRDCVSMTFGKQKYIQLVCGESESVIKISNEILETDFDVDTEGLIPFSIASDSGTLCFENFEGIDAIWVKEEDFMRVVYYFNDEMI